MKYLIYIATGAAFTIELKLLSHAESSSDWNYGLCILKASFVLNFIVQTNKPIYLLQHTSLLCYRSIDTFLVNLTLVLDKESFQKLSKRLRLYISVHWLSLNIAVAAEYSYNYLNITKWFTSSVSLYSVTISFHYITLLTPNKIRYFILYQVYWLT